MVKAKFTTDGMDLFINGRKVIQAGSLFPAGTGLRLRKNKDRIRFFQAGRLPKMTLFISDMCRDLKRNGVIFLL